MLLNGDYKRFEQVMTYMGQYASQGYSRFVAAQKLLNERPEFKDLEQYITNFNTELFNYFKSISDGFKY